MTHDWSETVIAVQECASMLRSLVAPPPPPSPTMLECDAEATVAAPRPSSPILFGGDVRVFTIACSAPPPAAAAASSSLAAAAPAAASSVWPLEWHSWAALQERIGASEGNVARFTSTIANGELSYTRVRDGTTMTVDAFAARLAEECAAARALDPSAELDATRTKKKRRRLTARPPKPNPTFHYLFDVPLSDAMNDALSAMHAVPSSFGPRGSMNMHQYLPSAFDTARDVNGRLLFPRWVLFISPPVHRRVSTAAHSDGGGYFVTVHMVAPCSNPNAQNRVGTCTREQAALGADDTEYSEPQQAKYAIDATGGSNNHYRFTSDLNLSTAEAQASVHGCRYPAVTTFGRGECVVQPPGLIHHYQKELIAPGAFVDNKRGMQNDGALQPGGGDPLPMVGVAGTDVLLGASESEAAANIGIYTRHAAAMAKRHRSSGARTFSSPRVDLELWLAVVCTGQWRDTLALGGVQRAHLRAAVAAITARIALEDRRHEQILAAQGGEVRFDDRAVHDARLQLAFTAAPLATASSASASAPTAADPAIRATGIHLHCACVQCGAHIFRRFYTVGARPPPAAAASSAAPSAATTDASVNAARWCGECVVSVTAHNTSGRRSPDTYAYGVRFGRQEDDASAMLAATRERLTSAPP